MDIEVWRPVVGFEDRYSVSDQGGVRSEARLVIGSHVGTFHRRKQRVLKPSVNPDGYLQVKLSVDGASWTCGVAVLVAAAFIGPRPTPKHEVCHGDDDTQNNRVANLRYDTKSGNQKDRLRTGAGFKLTKEKAADIRASKSRATELAHQFGVSLATINNIRAGRAWL